MGRVSFRDGSPSGKAGNSKQISKEHPPREGVLLPPSFTNSKPLDDASVPRDILLFQIIEQAPTLSYQLQQPAARVVVLSMDLEMLRKIADTLAEDGNLNFRRAGIR